MRTYKAGLAIGVAFAALLAGGGGLDWQVGRAGEHLRRRGPDAEEGAGGRSEGPG